MRRRGALVAAALAGALLPGHAASAERPGRAVIVQVRPSASALGAVAPGQVAPLLRRRAERDQAPLMHVLRAAERRGEASDVRPLWITDAIALRARPALIERLRRRADVLAVRPDRALRLRPSGLAAAGAVPGTNVAATGAPQLWAQGQTGRGALVAVLDTGISPAFPQLAAVAGGWFDPYEQHPAPFDDDARGHGTEVAEVIASMAPDVRIIAARVFGDGGRSTTSAVHRVFEWVLDPDGNPRTDDAPSVVNGSWDDGGPGRCKSEFDDDLAAMRAAGIVPVFAAGNAGPGPNTGASPASAPGAVAVGSVSSADVVSPFSGRGPSACRNAIFPTIAAYGQEIALEGPAGATVVSGTSFATPQVTGALALLAAMFPGATPDALVDALTRGARDVGAPGADSDTGAGIVNVPQAAALLAGADHAGPHVSVSARWSTDISRLGLLLTGRAEERGGGTSDGLVAAAFISQHGVPAAPLAVETTPTGATSAALAGVVRPRDARRLFDGRHRLYVRARDAAGNWGPARPIVIPADRIAPVVRASGARRDNVVSTTLHVRERGSGLILLRYRVEVGGRAGRWRVLAPAVRVRLALRVTQGRRATLRVRAVDVVGNETVAGFRLPR